MWSEIVAIYRSSKKKQDINWFTEWIARPPAAVVVYAAAQHADHAEPGDVPVGDRRRRARARCSRCCPGLAVARRRGARVRILVRPRLRRRPARAPAQDRVAGRPPARLPDGRAEGDAALRLRRRPAVAGDAATNGCSSSGSPGCSASRPGISLTSFMRRPEYGAKPIDRGWPARRGRQAARARSASRSTRSSGRRASSCTTRSTCGSARVVESHRHLLLGVRGRERRSTSAKSLADDPAPARKVLTPMADTDDQARDPDRRRPRQAARHAHRGDPEVHGRRSARKPILGWVWDALSLGRRRRARRDPRLPRRRARDASCAALVAEGRRSSTTPSGRRTTSCCRWRARARTSISLTYMTYTRHHLHARRSRAPPPRRPPRSAS